MNIFSLLKSGISRTIRARKGILIYWLCLFILVLTVIYPVRHSLYTAFGSSMITEKLNAGFDLESFIDLGPAFSVIRSFLLSGLLYLIFAGFVLNAFLTGGLFSGVKNTTGNFSAKEFFQAGADNFWSFLFISFISTVVLALLFLILIGIPAGILSISETPSERNMMIVIIVALAVYLLLLPVLLMVADFARAWKTANKDGSAAKAFGAGFRITFSNFAKSYSLMLVLLILQLLLGALIFILLPGWKPVTGGGVFLLLIISQIMFCLRLAVKTWRYASITALLVDIKSE